MDYNMTESMRSLRTNLLFCGDDIKSVIITSTLPDEGKSTISMNIARSFAEMGRKTILIDADLRKSVVLSVNGIRLENRGTIFGLSHYLSGQKKLEEITYETEVENLHMIVAGPVVSNSTELLDKKYFNRMLERYREEYDMVIIDGSPLGLVIDSAVMAPKCDGTILVVEQGNADRKMIYSVKQQLNTAGANILGVVLNKVKSSTTGYYKRYYKKGYGYGYGHGYYRKDGEEDSYEAIK